MKQHGGMKKATGRKQRPLSSVPGSGRSSGPGPRDHGLFELPGAEPEDEFVVPPGLTVADVIEHLAVSGAPPEILEHAAGFGDDLQGLLRWLDISASLADTEGQVAAILASWEPMLERGVTAIDAESFGFEFLAMFRIAAQGGAPAGPEDALVGLLHQSSQIGGPAALAMARVLAHIGSSEIRPLATSIANLLATSGVKDRPWARDLLPAVWVSASGYVDPTGIQQTIAVEFGVGRKTHALVVLVDHRLGGGVKDCWSTDDARRLFVQLRLGAIGGGVPYEQYSRDQSVAILRATLSCPPCPVEAEQIGDVANYLPMLHLRMAQIGGSLPAIAAAKVVAPARANNVTDREIPAAPASPTRTPARRSARRAGPIHRIKVTLAHSTPPIWRRLEVPSATSLAALSDIIQIAFDWDGSHLYAFETPGGTYSSRDSDLLDAGKLKLGVAAPRVGSKITYTYDFGDDWRHLIVVEGIGPTETGVEYPQCTDGRRAAPPEDCGGPGGYENLIAVLADPDDPEHEAMLEWLELFPGEEFDPVAFDADDVTRNLHEG